MPIAYAPLRTLRDVEELERVPLDERIFSWDLNDWIARGCALDPDKVAIRYIADGDPDGAAEARILRAQRNQRFLDDQLGFGTWNQHRGRDDELAAPELLVTQDVGRRFTLLAPRQPFREARFQRSRP